jgi:hypothetical protein
MNDADETLVRDVLHRATDDLTAPATSLAATAAVRGRSLRRRRRAVAAVGTLCAVSLVAVPVVAALGGSSLTTAPQVATDSTPAPTPTPTPEPTPRLVDNDAWAQMPAAEMATTFEGLAPAGIGLTDVMLTNEDRAPGEPETDSPGYLLADLTLDGETVGGLNAILYVTGQRANMYSCPGNLSSPDECVEIKDADGHVVGRRSVSTLGEVMVNEVVLVRPNGGLVYVAASNSPDDKWSSGSTVAGPTVPLTLDQLQAIAEDDAWIGYEPTADSTN